MKVTLIVAALKQKKSAADGSMFKVNLGEHQRENCRSPLSLRLASHMAVSSRCDERPFTLTEIRQTRLRHDLMLNYIANWMWKFSILPPGLASFDGFFLFFMKVKTARKADLEPHVCTCVLGHLLLSIRAAQKELVKKFRLDRRVVYR